MGKHYIWRLWVGLQLSMMICIKEHGQLGFPNPRWYQIIRCILYTGIGHKDFPQSGFQNLFNIDGMKHQGLCWLFIARSILCPSPWAASPLPASFQLGSAIGKPQEERRGERSQGIVFLIPSLLWHHWPDGSYRSLWCMFTPVGLSFRTPALTGIRRYSSPLALWP